jgi:sugar lactone lactonase YvrE
MKLNIVGPLLAVVLGITAARSAPLAGLDLPASSHSRIVDFDLPTGYLAEQIFAPPVQSPRHVAVSLAGTIVVTGGDDRVTQIHEDGSLTTYADPSSFNYNGSVFDAAGNLFVGDGAGVIWKITPTGTATQLATGVTGNDALDVAPSGDVFVVSNSNVVWRITPAGQVSVYASGSFRANDVAVSPITGVAYLSDWSAGAIFRINANGTLTLLTSGLGADVNYIAFAPDGTLYVMSTITGFSIVSTVDGARTELTWMQDMPSGGEFAFDNQRRFTTANVTEGHVVRYNLDTHAMDILVQGLGNSTALAVAPGSDRVFFGADALMPDDPGRVMRIEADHSATSFMSMPDSRVRAMAFDAAGTGYIAAGDTVYTMTLTGITGTLTVLPDEVGHSIYSLAIEPSTGRLWGSTEDKLWYVDNLDIYHTIPFTLGIGLFPFHSIAFTPDGTLYAYTVTGDPNVAPVAHGVYRVDPAGPTYTLIADLTTIHVCCLGPSQIGAGRDGNIYWVGFSDRYAVGNESSDMQMLRITPAGAVTVFARHLPIDPRSVAGSPNSTDLYFSGSRGVYRIFEADMTLLPILYKGSK